MSDWLALLPDAPVEWAWCLWRATWQGSVGLAVVWLICGLVRIMPARYQSWLWRFPDALARYAEVLLTVVNQPQPISMLPGLAAGAADHYQTLRTRIVAMKSFRQAPCQVIIVSAVLVSLVAALGIAPWRLVAGEAAEAVAAEPAEQTDPVKLSPAQEKILQALKQPTRFEFSRTPLEQVVEHVKDLHKIDLRLDEETLQEAGIASDKTVTFAVRDVNLNNALWLMLREHGLAHVIRADALLITTPQAAQQIVQKGGINPDKVELWSGNSKVFQALADPAVMEFIEQPLQVIIDYLQNAHEIPIRLDKRVLGKGTAHTDTPVTIDIRDISLNSSLRLMLPEIGLTHVVSHGLLLITTPKERDWLVQRVAFEPDDIRLSPGNKWILPALADITTLEFINTPLQDVADYLKDLHSSRIKLAEGPIEKAGIGVDVPVTENLKGATLHSALKRILGQRGLAHVVQHEVLLITTAEDGRRRLLSGALAPTDGEPARSTPIAVALKKPVTVECREKPLSELVDDLKRQVNVEIRIDDWELAIAGLKRDFPCTISMTNMPLESVLKQLLHDAGLGYFVEEDLIVIAGRDAHVRRQRQTPDNLAYRLKRMRVHLDWKREGREAHIVGVSFGTVAKCVTDADFEKLRSLSRLEHLDLSRTKVTDAGLAQLSDYPQLKLLELSHTQISDAGMAHVAGLPQLESLWLMSTQVTDTGLQHIQGLTRLRRLHVSSPHVTDAGLRCLSGLEQLEVLFLLNTKATGAGLEHLAAPRQLRELRLIRPELSGAELEHIAGCTQLEELTLWADGVTDADLKHLQGLSRLRALNMKCPKVSDAGLKPLAGLALLSRLELPGAQVTDAGLVHLAGLIQLTSLDLSQTQVTGVGLAHLRATKLAGISLAQSKVDDAGLADLKELTSLKRLNLSDTPITDASLVHIRAWLQAVGATKTTNDDPFAGGSAESRAYLHVHRTKITRIALAELRLDFPGLRAFGD